VISDLNDEETESLDIRKGANPARRTLQTPNSSTLNYHHCQTE
jgi:hypothetical protein